MKLLKYIRIPTLAVLDKLIPKRSDIWVFPVYFIGSGTFSDNARAVFEEVKFDKSIKKILLRRSLPIDAEGINVRIVQMRSYSALWYMMRARVIFTQHSLWLDYAKAKLQIYFRCGRIIINLWHGIPIKDISHKNTGIHSKRGLREMAGYFMPCSSETDRQHMRKAFHRTPPENFWITGLPRNDTLLAPAARLSTESQNDLDRLQRLKRGRHLIVYAPTYRETQAGGDYYDFTETELDTLEALCRENGAVFGIRYHIYRRPEIIRRIVARDFVVDLSAENYPDMRLIARETDVLVTDYSSVFLDALYLGRSCLCFAYDRLQYERSQRGLFYPLEDLFGSDLCTTFETLVSQLDFTLSTLPQIRRDPLDEARHDRLSRLFFSYKDDQNASRLAAKVRRSAFGSVR